MEFFKDLWDFMRVRKKFWLAPIIIVLLLLGGLIVLAEGTAVAPFIYTIFSPRVPVIVISGSSRSTTEVLWTMSVDHEISFAKLGLM